MAKSGKPTSGAKATAPEVKGPKIKTLKVPTQNTIERRAKHKIKAANRGYSGGSPITAPDINWDWFQDIMASRWPNTHRLRTMDAYAAQSRLVGRVMDEGISVVTVSHSESSARPSKKSLAKAKAAERRDGR